jgi:hypothetical protein
MLILHLGALMSLKERNLQIKDTGLKPLKQEITMKPIAVHYSLSRHCKTLGLNKVIGIMRKRWQLHAC